MAAGAWASARALGRLGYRGAGGSFRCTDLELTKSRDAPYGPQNTNSRLLSAVTQLHFWTWGGRRLATRLKLLRKLPLKKNKKTLWTCLNKKHIPKISLCAFQLWIIVAWEVKGNCGSMALCGIIPYKGGRSLTCCCVSMAVKRRFSFVSSPLPRYYLTFVFDTSSGSMNCLQSIYK